MRAKPPHRRPPSFVRRRGRVLAGSLYVPREREDIELGPTGGEHAEYDSLWRLHTRPLVKAGSLLIGRAAPAPAESPPRS